MPVQWTEEMAAQVRKMRENRASLDDVAIKVGVCVDTLVRWMKKEGLSTAPFYRQRQTYEQQANAPE